MYVHISIGQQCVLTLPHEIQTQTHARLSAFAMEFSEFMSSNPGTNLLSLSLFLPLSHSNPHPPFQKTPTNCHIAVSCCCRCCCCFALRQVLDYTQYYLDLAAANALGEAVWQPEYNLTTQYFGSGEVNAIALHNLADRFSTGEGPLFAK